MAGKGKYPKYVDDIPPGEDLFEGRSQNELAYGIAKLIRDDNKKRKLIGLDGAWGSGKTNLIKILKTILEKTHHVFIYDAWGHQEDLQRRSFLEELTEDLCNKNIINKDYWKKRLKDLLAKKRETETKTIPHLSGGIIAIIFIIILTPIFKVIADIITYQILKIIVVSLPLIISIVIYLVIKITKKQPPNLYEIFYMYKEKELENKIFEVISENEPSAREFREWMHDLSNDLNEKNLIIVFDNMDRLPVDKVQDLWASIHTFFAEKSYSDIWTIVTFDRNHIRIAFKSDEDNSDEEKADDFINRTFSAVYRIAPPILTDWQKFFKLKYQEAFGITEEDEFKITRNIFDLRQRFITPRKIISFINELVSLKKTTRDQILMRYLAIFTLFKKDILSDPVEKILKSDYLLQAAPLFEGDGGLHDNIAALVYNLPVKNASQVTHQREIEIALRGKNINRLNELAIHPHFMDILEKVINSYDQELENAIITLNQLNKSLLKSENVQKELAHIWDILSNKQMKLELQKHKITEAHKILLKNSTPNIKERLIIYLVKSLRNSKAFSGSTYFLGLKALEDFVNEEKLHFDISKIASEMELGPTQFLDYLSVAKNEYNKYKVSCNEEELNKYLKSKVPDGLLDIPDLSFIKRQYDLTNFVNSLKEAVNNDRVTIENFNPIFTIYKSLAKEKPLEVELSDQKINTLLLKMKADTEGYYDLIAMRLAKGSRFTNFGNICQTILNNTEEKLVNKIAERIEYYCDYGDLLGEVISWKQPLLIEITKKITINEYGSSRMDISEILPHFESIYTSINIDPKKLLRNLDRWSKYAKEEITPENISEIIPDISFFEHAIGYDCELTKHAINIMNKYLGNRNVEEWCDSYNNESSYLFNVTYWLLKGEKRKSLPENALSAYKEKLKNIASGEHAIPENPKWDIYYEKAKNKLKPTIKDIRDLFIRDVVITPSRFLFFIGMFEKNGDLQSKSDDVTRKILTPVVSDDDCLKYITDKGAFFIPIIEKAGDDADDFKDLIRQKIDAEVSIENLQSFAKEIGI